MFESDKIALVGHVSDVVMYVALTAGLLILVIGYFAGAKKSMSKIMICTILVTVVGTLALRVPMAVHDLVTGKKSVQEQLFKKAGAAQPVQTEKPAPTGETIANLILYMMWTGFLVCIGIFLYEAMTTTAEEARPD